MARCIAEDCILSKFLKSYKGKLFEPVTVKKALSRAGMLLSMKHVPDWAH